MCAFNRVLASLQRLDDMQDASVVANVASPDPELALFQTLFGITAAPAMDLPLHVQRKHGIIMRDAHRGKKQRRQPTY